MLLLATIAVSYIAVSFSRILKQFWHDPEAILALDLSDQANIEKRREDGANSVYDTTKPILWNPITRSMHPCLKLETGFCEQLRFLLHL